MSESPEPSVEQAVVTIYCTQCGQAMRVAPEHVSSTVACPHCQTPLAPWRVVGAPPPQPAAPPPPPVYAYGPTYGVSSRHRVVAGVLGILLGPLGAHRFYLGYIGIGILQIVLTFMTGGIAGLWGFIEGILCLAGQMRDVDDLPLRE